MQQELAVYEVLRQKAGWKDPVDTKLTANLIGEYAKPNVDPDFPPNVLANILEFMGGPTAFAIATAAATATAIAATAAAPIGSTVDKTASAVAEMSLDDPSCACGKTGK